MAIAQTRKAAIELKDGAQPFRPVTSHSLDAEHLFETANIVIASNIDDIMCSYSVTL